MSVNVATESQGSEKLEKFVGECFVKTAQAILSSRVHETHAPGSKEQNEKRSPWFNLYLQEVESARKPLDRWRMERGIGLPLVLEIYLHPSTTFTTNTTSEDSPGTLVERWCLHYCPSVTGIALPLSPGGLSRSQMSRLDPKHVYKRLTLLIRSVYSYCRVLPAYKMYRTSKAYRSPPFTLQYKIHSTLPQRGDAASANVQRFEFSSVETADAQLNLYVEYQPASKIKVLQQQAQLRLPRAPIIQDYVRESNKTELERGKSQGTTTNHAVVGVSAGGAVLEPAPSAPAVLLSGGGSTPRRGWSSSFRLSPARIYEPAVYSHQKHPSPTFSASPSSSEMPSLAAAAAPGSGDSGGGGGQPEQREQLLVTKAMHPSSSPMAIPGTSAAHYKKRPHGFRSSGDLGALERRGRKGGGGGSDGDGSGAKTLVGGGARDDSMKREYTSDKPMSAPAVSYMHHSSTAPRATDEIEGEAKEAVDVPPLPSLTVKLNTASPSSSSTYPAPCSPDLPFAFTPSARHNYSCSPASVASGSGSGGASSNRLLHRPLSRPSPASPHSISGHHEIPVGTALMRRSSWGTRSRRDATLTATTAAALIAGGAVAQGVQINTVGYSVSPIRDIMLESVVLSAASTPRNLLGYKPKKKVVGSDVFLASSTTTTTAGVGESGFSSKRDRLLLTFPSTVLPSGGGTTPDTTKGVAVWGGRLPREDSEQLPFDFTAESSEEHSHHSNINDCSEEIDFSTDAAGKAAPAAEARRAEKPSFDVQSSAASIGSFMRLINEAQPLSGLAPIPLEVGMQQLEALKTKILSGQQR